MELTVNSSMMPSLRQNFFIFFLSLLIVKLIANESHLTLGMSI